MDFDHYFLIDRPTRNYFNLLGKINLSMQKEWGFKKKDYNNLNVIENNK
jgi:hypothetical protein